MIESLSSESALNQAKYARIEPTTTIKVLNPVATPAGASRKSIRGLL
jgi:hypothetical protein